MSRLAKKPIKILKNVTVTTAKNKVTVKGPKGTLGFDISEGVHLEIKGENLYVSGSEELEEKAFLGLERSRLANAVKGVSEGFEKKLELVGVGFKATVKGKEVDLSLGFSHPNIVPIPAGVEVKVDKNTLISITGIDKQLVGQFAATLRSLRPPEPYKGKGVKYVDEVVRRKAGKTAK